MKNFAIIGAAGYIASRHMKAILETGNKLVTALDKNDSVGILDSYFPDADFFVELERFDRHIDLLKRKDIFIDFVSILSPNYLHDSHIRFALKHGADAICEKPLVLNPHNIDALKIVEEETEKKIYSILQLRLHPTIIELKSKIETILKTQPDKIFEINLTYITSRGSWYLNSWKGDVKKSGGIATNIGVHFFDMLGWIFGELQLNEVHFNSETTSSGYLEFKNARVKWFLSIDYALLPNTIKKSGARTFRSIDVDGNEIEFSSGFTDLHTASYNAILSGNGFGIDESFRSIEIVSMIRQLPVKTNSKNLHAKLIKLKG